MAERGSVQSSTMPVEPTVGSGPSRCHSQRKRMNTAKKWLDSPSMKNRTGSPVEPLVIPNQPSSMSALPTRRPKSSR